MHEIRRSSVWTPQRSSYAGHLQVSRKGHLQRLLLFSAAPLQPSERTSILLSNSPLLLPLPSRIEIQILLASPFARHEILPRKMFSYPSRIKACVLCKLLIGLIVSIQPFLYPTSIVLSMSPILVLAICSFKNKIQRTELS